MTWSNGFCGGRGKRDALLEKGRGPMVENYCYNNSFMIFFSGEEKIKTREDKRMVKLGFYFFSKLPFLGIC
jgi:hypothetical protein